MTFTSLATTNKILRQTRDLSEEDWTEALDCHNNLRGQVAKDSDACNMQEMVGTLFLFIQDVSFRIRR